jgi:hypothetical protein
MLGLSPLVGCRETTNPVELSARVVNQPGSFEYRSDGLTGVTYQAVYLWPNTGTSATIEHSTVVQSGQVRLTLVDPHARVMYDVELRPGAALEVGVGAVGSWSVIVTVTDFTGTIDFRVRQLWIG